MALDIKWKLNFAITEIKYIVKCIQIENINLFTN